MKLGSMIFQRTLAIWLLMFMITATGVYSSAPSDTSIFTAEELEWLVQNGPITVAPDPEYAPIEYWSDGSFKGITIDYLDAIGKRYDLEFELIHFDTWADILEAAKAGKIQMLSAAVATDARREYLEFTAPILTMPNQFYIRTGTEPIGSLENLQTLKLGAIEGYSSVDYLRLIMPNANLLLVKDIREGLSKLSVGDLDAFIGDSGQVSYYADLYSFNQISLDSSVEIDFPLHLAIGIKKGEPELLSIMNKINKDFPHEEFDTIKAKWFKYKIVDSTKELQSRRLIYLALALGSSVILLFILWNRTLSRTVQERTLQLKDELDKSLTYEQQLRLLIDLIPYPMFLKDSSYHFITVNEAYARFYDMRKEDIEGKLDLDVYATNKNTPLNKYRIHEDEILTDHTEVHLKSHTLIDASGTPHIFDIRKVPFPIVNSEHMGILSISVDITDIKNHEKERLMALNRIVSNVAHQVNTPLGNVVSANSYINMLRDDLSDRMKSGALSKDDLSHYFQSIVEANRIIEASLNRIIAIVDAFKSLSISTEDLSSSRITLRPFFEHIVAEKVSLRIFETVYHFDSDVVVQTYANVLEEIVQQILNNAVQHGFLNMPDQKNRIDVHLASINNDMTLIISDNGVGIPQDKLRHVSDPLYSSTQFFGNLGIGLSVSKNMAQELLGGDITLENRKEGGLSVIIRFKNQEQ